MTKHTNKFVLLYSAQYVKKIRPANRAINNDGKEVEYTEMCDQAQFGKWQERCLWDDTIEVGFIDRNDQVTYCSPMMTHNTGNIKLDAILFLEQIKKAQNKPNKFDEIVSGIIERNSNN